MTDQTSKPDTVQENVTEEIGNLKSEIRQLSQDIRDRIDAAGDEAKKTWSKLDDERKRFLQRVEQAAEETKSDLRQAGSDLKRRLSGLRQEIKGEGGGQGSSQSQSGGTSS